MADDRARLLAKLIEPPLARRAPAGASPRPEAGR